MLPQNQDSSCVSSCASCLYVWLQSHICPSQKRIFQIEIRTAAPTGLLLPPSSSHSVFLWALLSSLPSSPSSHPLQFGDMPHLNTFFFSLSSISSQKSRCEFSPRLHFSHEALTLPGLRSQLQTSSLSGFVEFSWEFEQFLMQIYLPLKSLNNEIYCVIVNWLYIHQTSYAVSAAYVNILVSFLCFRIYNFSSVIMSGKVVYCWLTPWWYIVYVFSWSDDCGQYSCVYMYCQTKRTKRRICFLNPTMGKFQCV